MDKKRVLSKGPTAATQASERTSASLLPAAVCAGDETPLFATPPAAAPRAAANMAICATVSTCDGGSGAAAALTGRSAAAGCDAADGAAPPTRAALAAGACSAAAAAGAAPVAAPAAGSAASGALRFRGFLAGGFSPMRSMAPAFTKKPWCFVCRASRFSTASMNCRLLSPLRALCYQNDRTGRCS